MSNRAIVSRTYYRICVTIISPVNISNGISTDTDADVMRNGRGECFIPGTSLAGAFRSYRGDDKDRDSIFGYSAGEEGRMSTVFISDLYFDKDSVNVSVRDRVKLTDSKNVDNKFDTEIIEQGARGSFTIETVNREGMNEKIGNPDNVIPEILMAMHDGDIRLGSAKNRGFGRVSIDTVSSVTFTRDNKADWINYLAEDNDKTYKAVSFEEWRKGRQRQIVKYDKYIVPLRLTGGISIRRYSTKPDKADFEHITSNGVPVIPGTSWNGAIRADAKQLIIDMGKSAGIPDSRINKAAAELIDKWFGKVKAGDKDKESWQSNIVIAESEIKGARYLPMTRNNINRFTSGTKDGALYTELSCIGGTTQLEYMIANHKGSESEQEMKALEGIMRLVVRDICEGMIAVGGQVSVGRGIFKGNYDEWVSSLPDSSDECLKALYDEIIRRVNSEY